jgi:hypothetical protein
VVEWLVPLRDLPLVGVEETVLPSKPPVSRPPALAAEELAAEPVSGKGAQQMSFASAPVEEALDTSDALCADIARLKAVDLAKVDAGTRQWVAEPQDPATRSLQRTVRGAVQRLAADLYSGEAHYLLELVQNADDCRYPADTVPTLRITVERDPANFRSWTTFKAGAHAGLVCFEYNEEGFSQRHVRALCDIAQSTKTSGYAIGAKGIGFKSVFRVTPTPVVHSTGESGAFHFHFDADALGGLGYLIPFPLPPLRHLEGTRIVLPVKSHADAATLAARVMEDADPSLLLFLRKLQQLVLCAGQRRTVSKAVSTLGEGAERVELRVEPGGTETWIYSTQTFPCRPASRAWVQRLP